MFEAVFTDKELAEYFSVKPSSIKASAKKLGYKSGPYSLKVSIHAPVKRRRILWSMIGYLIWKKQSNSC